MHSLWGRLCPVWLPSSLSVLHAYKHQKWCIPWVTGSQRRESQHWQSTCGLCANTEILSSRSHIHRHPTKRVFHAPQVRWVVREYCMRYCALLQWGTCHRKIWRTPAIAPNQFQCDRGRLGRRFKTHAHAGHYYVTDCHTKNWTDWRAHTVPGKTN
jgi:hypothetical protein